VTWRGLEVAGLRLAIEAPPALPWAWPEGPLRRFVASPEDPHLRVRVEVGRPASRPGLELAYDSGGGIFDVARDGGDWVFALAIHGRVQRLARFDADFREGVVVVDPDSFYARDVHYPLAYPLDELIFLHRLAREGGLLLHACGVVREGHARLFTGRSGAGKTTLARLELARGGCEVLSDDRVVLWETSDGSFEVCGTPWHGDAPLARAARAPLGAIHAIRQARDLGARHLGGVSAAAAVLGNAFLPAHDAVGAERTLALAERLVSRVPVGELAFPLDAGVVPFAWSQPAAARA